MGLDAYTGSAIATAALASKAGAAVNPASSNHGLAVATPQTRFASCVRSSQC